MTLLGDGSWCFCVWQIRLEEPGAEEIKKETLHRRLDSSWVQLDKSSSLWLKQYRTMTVLWKIKGKVLEILEDILSIKQKRIIFICFLSEQKYHYEFGKILEK
jgi:hypothetical protein